MWIQWTAAVLLSVAFSLHAASIPPASPLSDHPLQGIHASSQTLKPLHNPQILPQQNFHTPQNLIKQSSIPLQNPEILPQEHPNTLQYFKQPPSPFQNSENLPQRPSIPLKNPPILTQSPNSQNQSPSPANDRDVTALKSLAREAKLLDQPRAAHRTLDRSASELAWKNWLQSPESRDPGAPPRRITPKSVFIAPPNCPEGKRLSEEGCISVHTVGKEAHDQYILNHLNSMTDAGAVVYDYDEEPGPSIDAAEGPLQLNLPLGVFTSQGSLSQLSLNGDKKDDKRFEAEELEAELEKLKQEIDKIAIHELQRPATHLVVDAYPRPQDKPKRDNNRVNTSASGDDKGQKEVIYGAVGVDAYAHAALQMTTEQTTEQQTTEQPTTTTDQTTTQLPTTTESTTLMTTESERMTTDAETTTDPTLPTTDAPATTARRALDERPPELHPELEYADIGEAIKLISRYAEVTTDESFDAARRRAEPGTLGTRTRTQHRRPARTDYYRYPAPPPDFPFRHVQEYWAGLDALRPRRHHHSLLQPPRRATRPAPRPAPRWLTADGAAER